MIINSKIYSQCQKLQGVIDESMGPILWDDHVVLRLDLTETWLKIKLGHPSFILRARVSGQIDDLLLRFYL